MNEVSVFALSRRDGSKKPWQVRWRCHGRDRSRQFTKKGTADRLRATLLLAVANGEPFDPRTGLPWRPDDEDTDDAATVYGLAVRFMANRWPGWAGKTRSSAVEAITDAVLTLTLDTRQQPDLEAVRAWLREVALLGIEPGDLPASVRDRSDQAAHQWLSHASLPLRDLDTGAAEEVLHAYAVKRDGSRAAANTINRKRIQFHAMLKHAVKNRLLDYDPLAYSDWKPPRTSKTVDPTIVPSTEEAETLFAALDTCCTSGPPLRAFFETLFYAGLRISEARALRTVDLTLPDQGWGEITVRRSYTSPGTRFTDNGQVDEKRDLKGRGEGAIRRVPIPPRLVQVLRQHLEKYPPGERDWIFTNGKGNLWQTSRIGRTWTSAKQNALPKGSPMHRIRPYDLRHGNATLLLSAGVQIPHVAARLGHAPEVLLSTYAHALNNDRQRANNRVDEYLAADPIPESATLPSPAPRSAEQTRP